MPIKRQVSENLESFHCRLPKPIKDRLMIESQSRGISAAMVVTELVEFNLLGKKKPSVTFNEHDADQVDLEGWLARNA